MGRHDCVLFLDLAHKNLLQVLVSQLLSSWLSDMGAAIGQAPGMTAVPPLFEFLESPCEKEIKLLIKEPLNAGVLFIQFSLT